MELDGLKSAGLPARRLASPEPGPTAAPSGPALAPDAFERNRPVVPTRGVQRHGLSRLPATARAVVAAVAGWLGSTFRKAKEAVFRPDVPADPGRPRERAEAVWGQMERLYGVPGLKGVFSETTNGGHSATVWPHGQAIAAALDIAQLTGDYSKVDATMRTLSAYETRGAYSPVLRATNDEKRLWDDNAWVGLDMMQAYLQTGNEAYLAKAESLFPFMKEGLHPEGGLYWMEKAEPMTRNTCGNAPAIQLALRLYQATRKPEYLAFAKNLDGFMNEKLRSPEGLYYDNLGDDGKLNTWIFSYNQGAALGADVLWYRTTGDAKYLERAKQTADAALKHFGTEDRLWKQSPAFNAIFFRNLLALDAVAPDPRYRATLEAYVDRIWKEGRDPATGELSQGGIGQYGPPGLLDQAGFAQMCALLGWPKDRLQDVG